MGSRSGLTGVLEVLQRALRQVDGGNHREERATALPEQSEVDPLDNDLAEQLSWCVNEIAKMVDACAQGRSDPVVASLEPPGNRRRNSFQQIEAEEAQIHSSVAGDAHTQQVGSWMVNTYTDVSEAHTRAKEMLSGRARSKSLSFNEDTSAAPPPTTSSIVADLRSVHSVLSREHQPGHPAVFVSEDDTVGLAPDPQGGGGSTSTASSPDPHKGEWARGFGLDAEHHPPHRASLPGEDPQGPGAPFATKMLATRSATSLLEARSAGKRRSLCSSDDGFLRELSNTSGDSEESSPCSGSAGEAADSEAVDTYLAEINHLLSRVNKWNLNIFRLAELNAGSPLAVLGLRILSERNLIESLHLNRTKLINFLCRVEDGYGRFPTVEYHNNLHGADVMHSTHVLLNHPALKGAFSDLEVFTAIIAAAIHDLNHRGRTNAFLIKTRHEWATLYNDVSVLENHHVASAFRIMEDDDCNFLDTFDREEFLVVRKLMIDMVLSTDMARHTKFLGEFKTLIDARCVSEAGPDSPRMMSIATQLSDSYPDRALVLCAIVHNADLANCAKEWPLAKKWTYRLMEEFCAEGDEERRQGLPLGPLNDRETMDIPKGQVGFINFIALPLWKAWANYVSPKAQSVQLDHLIQNLGQWKNLIAANPESKVPPATAIDKDQPTPKD
eukprot:m.391492 g.391492  ORF g.391492 m.391492 type:complete len:669 (+) comp28316_c0_seq11:5319-7325(+)